MPCNMGIDDAAVALGSVLTLTSWCRGVSLDWVAGESVIVVYHDGSQHDYMRIAQWPPKPDPGYRVVYRERP